jgi:hypothetical protein
VEKLKKCKVPMLYYNDKIPDVELCKLSNEFGENNINANTTNVQMNMLPRCYSFFPILR